MGEPFVCDLSEMKVKPFEFRESFLTSFNKITSVLDKKLNELHKVSADKDVSHGICTCSYKMRYITPSDVSTFISYLEKALKNKMLKPNIGDCEMFAVASVKKFMEKNGCVPFESSSIMGNKYSLLPKGTTLGDLLLLCSNDVYALNVYSSYEMNERINRIQSDIKKLEGLHFTANMRNFVKKIPDIMTKNTKRVLCDDMRREMFVIYIEEFLMFSCQLLLNTVCCMLRYATPKCSFKTCEDAENCLKNMKSNESANNSDNWDDDNEFFKESVDTEKYEPIYVILKEGTGPVGDIIKKQSNSIFSHASITFDPSFNIGYSYSATGEESYYKNKMNSMIRESIRDGGYQKHYFAMYVTFVPKKTKKMLIETCERMISEKTKYDMPLLLKMWFIGGNQYNTEKNGDVNVQMCSTFIDYLISLTGRKFNDDIRNISPADIFRSAESHPHEFHEVFHNKGIFYDEDEIRKKTEEFAKEKETKPWVKVVNEYYDNLWDDDDEYFNESKTSNVDNENIYPSNSNKFDEVITECCLLKTNDIMIMNKLPFNYNMRSIVLQDLHPFFKDTKSALRFIMNDNRSPIKFLILKHSSVENLQLYDEYGIFKMLFGEPHHHYDPRNAVAHMHTDVNWLDKITYGNKFLDCNYRNDSVGNNKTDSITHKLDMLYKMCGGCDCNNDNETCANTLIKIYNLMESIIKIFEESDDEVRENRDAIRDVLALLGEIFTCKLLMLYHNNTLVIHPSDDMDDTMTPAYMYVEESFVMEADNNTPSEPKVSANGETVDDSGINVQKIKNVIRKFLDWIRNALHEAIPNWFKNTAHNAAVKWIKDSKTEKKHNEIREAMSRMGEGGFKVHLDDWPAYNLACNFSEINVEATIDEWMSGSKAQEAIDKIAIRNALLPKGAGEAIGDKTGSEFKEAMKNFILWKQIEPKQPTSIDMTAQQFDELRADLLSSDNFSQEFAKLSDQLSKACKNLDSKISTGNQSNPRAKELFDIITEVSSTCYTLETNLYLQTFWPYSYKTYAKIFQLYEQQKKDGSLSTGENNANNTNTQTTQATQNTQTNAQVNQQVQQQNSGVSSGPIQMTTNPNAQV